ncbi:SDR family oxidoreductase [Bacillus thuringiensis]|uniref:UDP-glucose 4-epimerase n=1 Tax=Bacillus thuringiensis TaxID=1428 RepID=A0ABD6R971_BACTU|nr:SDR family oxidoreductase [Bacillus thuringiensis]HEF1900791.1 SDR family oxidoreductase [Bacillus cereus]MED2753454.1 SDR family oxidoreductase [Bacillus thuringiensis]MED2756139.1 SDR family oxidoreductase [Bacillus thuringiensis]MED2769595.1 SDR family oxidoreductase [Bacillus thuringiensis]MED2774208.1 SDR family oxidoreductase [Bacillus thuringiensis]
MKILILGGTRFLGRAVVEEALNRGHEVTLFNRGTNKEFFPEVEQLIGDRNGDVSSLENRKWDAVVDTCGFSPHHIRNVGEVLQNNIKHYIFISSLSVYKDWIPHDIKEDYILQPEPTEEQIKAVENGEISPYEHYGALKVLCEKEAEKYWPGRVLHVRAGLLSGMFDYTDRLPYWIGRVAKGGKVLVPGRKIRPVQLVDIKDVAGWGLNMAEHNKAGTFNITGPNDELTMEELLNTCKKVTNSDAEFVWVDESFMSEHNVQPWTEMPLWIPETFPLDGETKPWRGGFSICIESAVNEGLTFRRIEETVTDVYEWMESTEEWELKAGISGEREKVLLDKWYERKRV